MQNEVTFSARMKTILGNLPAICNGHLLLELISHLGWRLNPFAPGGFDPGNYPGGDLSTNSYILAFGFFLMPPSINVEPLIE